MEYRITKDCGPWWEQSLEPETFAWGVAESQCRFAKHVAAGDILLHFIDGAHAWAGYSEVTGMIKPNDRDKEVAWKEALPEVIPIKRGVWLNKKEAFLCVSVVGLLGQNYHRKPSFTAMKPDEAKLIVAATNEAKGKESEPTSEFNQRWDRDAEKFYWEIVRAISGGMCWLCSERAETWVEKHGWELRKQEVAAIQERFLDVAHIEARAKKGRTVARQREMPLSKLPSNRRWISEASRKALLQGPKPTFT